MVRTSQLQRHCRALSVDGIERMLACAAPPAGQPGHDRIWLLESNANSRQGQIQAK